MPEDLKDGQKCQGCLQPIKLITDICVGWFTILALSIGGGWAILQYKEHKNETSIARTLEYVQRYNTGAIAKHRWRLESNWDKEWEAIIKVREDQSKKVNEEIEEYSKIMIKLMEKDYSSFRKLENFFDEIANCALEGICSEEKAYKYFNYDASLFVVKYYPVICRLREKYRNPSFGEAMIKFFYEVTYETTSEELCKKET